MRVPVRIIQTRERNGLFSRLVRIDTGEEIDNVLLDGNPDWPWPAGHKVDMMLIFPFGITRFLPIVVVESVETRPERLLTPAVSDLQVLMRGVCPVCGLRAEQCSWLDLLPADYRRFLEVA